jgi:recombinational DNA repair protein (RecF pathway)
MLGLYILIIILQSLGLGAIKSGRVTKAGQPLQHAIVRVYSASLNHEIAHRVTDEEGRYYVLVPRSDVYVTIETKNPDGTYTKLFTSPTFHAGKGMISESYDL